MTVREADTVKRRGTGPYYSFNRFLERHMPRDLYRRSLIILMAPIVIIQLITAAIFLDRHWDQMTKALGRVLSNEIGLLIDLYEKSDKSPASVRNIEMLASERLKLDLKVEKGTHLPQQQAIPFYALFDSKMQKYLARETGKPFWVDSSADNNQVDIRVEVENGLVFHFLADQERAYAAGTPWLLGLMLFSALLLTTIAVLFLRNQVRPILELAKAAQGFGLGREVGAYEPRGAAEVRLAGLAFLEMKRRIGRHVEQRTAMLAGVSHDLRTILTRFRLGLAVLGDDKKMQPLRDDVNEMQKMLEDYMNFVRGDGGEMPMPVQIKDAVTSVADVANRIEQKITVNGVPSVTLPLKPTAFRRLLSNILGNATRHASNVTISGELKGERLWLYVDDDGPGIPASQRESAFRPFVRLDEARNMDQTGTGLGLAIALDIAHAHGGDINLDDSPMGGLRVAVKIPV